MGFHFIVKYKLLKYKIMYKKGLICQILFSIKDNKAKFESIRTVYNKKAMDALEITEDTLKGRLADVIEVSDGMYFAEVGLEVGFPLWTEFH